MLKKIFVFFFCFLIFVLFVSSVFADNEFQHYVIVDKQTFIDKFKNFVPFVVNGNTVQDIPESRLSALRQRVSMYPDEIQIFSGNRIFCMGNDTYKSDVSFYNGKGDYNSATIGCYMFDFPYGANLDTSHFSTASSFDNSYSVINDIRYFSCTNDVSIASYINDNDDFSFKKSGSHTSDWQILHYSGNILKAILDYYDYLHGDYQQFYDVDDVSGIYIKYYSAFDSYKGMYNEKFFGNDDIRNYLNSSVVFDDTLVDVYYSSDFDSVDTSDYYQHKEDVTFYVQFKDETTHNSLSALSDNSTVMNLMNSCTSVKHYTEDVISFSSWFDNLNINYYINSRHQFQFTMSNSYTYMSTLFQGSRVDTNATLISVNEQSDNVYDGFGGLTDSLGTKSDLRTKGWSNGYLNDDNYSYRVDIYKNAEKYIQIYFKNKPKTIAHYYTDSQIKYVLDLTKNKGYFYSVDYNLYKSFDFSEIEKVDNRLFLAILQKMNVDKNISLSNLQNYLDENFSDVSVGIGSDTFLKRIELVYNLVKSYFDLDNDIDNVKNYKLLLWTNYTGDINRSNWVGYHCRFNWDIDVDGSLTKANSDDNYDYHNDVVKDILSDSEIATEVSTSVDEQGNIISSYNTTYNYYNYYYSDNNGNTHGGGDNTYIATEPPTASELVYQSAVADFDFNAPTLWNYASSAMNFCKSAFTIFPGFIWLLIASGIVLVIALRLLGR